MCILTVYHGCIHLIQRKVRNHSRFQFFKRSEHRNTAATFREHKMRQRSGYVRRLEDMHLSCRLCHTLNLNSLVKCNFVIATSVPSFGQDHTKRCEFSAPTEVPMYFMMYLYRSCCNGYNINTWRQAVSTPAMGSVPAVSDGHALVPTQYAPHPYHEDCLMNTVADLPTSASYLDCLHLTAATPARPADSVRMYGDRHAVIPNMCHARQAEYCWMNTVNDPSPYTAHLG